MLFGFLFTSHPYPKSEVNRYEAKYKRIKRKFIEPATSFITSISFGEQIPMCHNRQIIPDREVTCVGTAKIQTSIKSSVHTRRRKIN